MDKSIVWEGVGVNELGRRADTGDIVVKVDERYFRPTEVNTLLGDATKAREKLGWVSTCTVEELVKEMVEHDLYNARKEVLLNNEEL